MKMRSCLIVCLLSLMAIGIGAQENTVPEKDIVILNNNSKLEGELIEVSKRFIYFKVGSVVYTLNKREVKRIFPRGQEITFISNEKVEKINKSPLFYEIKIKKEPLKNGFYNISYGNVSSSLLGVQNITGYQYNKNLGIGLGVGFINLLNFNRADKVVPVFSEIRGYFTDKKVSAYYTLAIGMNLGLKPNPDPDLKVKGGMFFHPAIGYKVGSDAAAFMIDIGIQIVNTNSITRSDFGRSEEKRKFQNVVLRLGIML